MIPLSNKERKEIINYLNSAESLILLNNADLTINDVLSFYSKIIIMIEVESKKILNGMLH